jgi:hypothetical protein
MNKLILYIIHKYYVENLYKNCSFLRVRRTVNISALREITEKYIRRKIGRIEPRMHRYKSDPCSSRNES